jgi:hypothetical protein
MGGTGPSSEPHFEFHSLFETHFYSPPSLLKAFQASYLLNLLVRVCFSFTHSLCSHQSQPLMMIMMTTTTGEGCKFHFVYPAMHFLCVCVSNLATASDPGLSPFMLPIR